MRFIGVDPGKAGGIAAIDDGGRVLQLATTPLVVVQERKKTREEYDLPAIRELLRAHAAAGPVFVVVEKGQPMPMEKGGTIANFNRGVARGWEWMLSALLMPYELVAPRTWQADMHAGTPGGDTKQRSFLAVHRLFPQVSLRRTSRCSTEHDGMAEALLLAEWGRRKHRPQPEAPRPAAPAPAQGSLL
jgi:hypothetical protein